MKTFVHEKLNMAHMIRFVLVNAENIVGKEKNAG